MSGSAAFCARKLLLIDPSSFYFSALRFAFPLQLLVGLAGNALNALILGSGGARTRTRGLLCSLAAADAAFLLLFLPEYLSTFPALARDAAFRRAYFAARIPCLSLANCASAASIWFTLAVTIERVVVVRQPLREVHVSRRALSALIFGIFAFAFLSTFYYNVWYRKEEFLGCRNYTDLPIYRYSSRTAGNSTEARLMTLYIQGSLILGIALIVAIPMLLLIVLNLLLVAFVRKSHQSVQRLGTGNSLQRQLNTERKMTITVITIVASFIVFNGPSVFTALWHFIDPHNLPWWHDLLSQISNSLVTTSKVTNFILYCMGSSSFRRKTIRIIRCQHTKHFNSRKAALESRLSVGPSQLRRVGEEESPDPGPTHIRLREDVPLLQVTRSSLLQ